MFFEGDTIYSWGTHWPIGRVVTLSDSCRTVAVIHNLSHTPSTNKHTSRAWMAAHYEARISKVYHVESDLFHKIHDESTLALAIHESEERIKDRAYEERIRRNEWAVRVRERNGGYAREALEETLGLDLSEMSNTFAIQLRNLLLGVPRNNFQAQSWRKSGERHGGMLDRYPALLAFVTTILDEDPERIKRPSFVFTMIENFKLLAA